MAEPGSRMTAGRVIKCLFFILFLLSLLYIGNLLIFNSPVDMFKESFTVLLEEAVRKKTEEQNRIEILSRLLDEARTLKNEEQLAFSGTFQEIFKQNLRKAVNEAYEQETEDNYRLLAAVEQFNQRMVELYPSLQIMKWASDTDPSSKHFVQVVERAMSKVKAFFFLKQRVFAEGAQYTEKNKNDILKSLHDLHDEL